MIFALFYDIIILTPFATIFRYLIDSSVLNLKVLKGQVPNILLFGSCMEVFNYVDMQWCICLLVSLHVTSDYEVVCLFYRGLENTSKDFKRNMEGIT